MQGNQGLTLSPSLDSYRDEDEFAETAGKISHDFNQQLNLENSRPTLADVKKSNDGEDQQETQFQQGEDEFEVEEEDDDDDDDFTFVLTGEDTSPISADEVFQDGQIRAFFPLFNQDILFGDDVSDSGLPIRDPVNKVFIESPRPPSSESDETDGIAAGPYCAWSKQAVPEVCKKSNSTGFSKLWRFKEKMHRSHSDGRDAFVFLNGSTSSSSGAKGEEKSVAKSEVSSDKKRIGRISLDKKTAGDGSSKIKTSGEVKVNKKGGKAKAPLSAHEVYLRNRVQAEEVRRRSYLPYRPELMGFFTNVNGGLSRNVHPF